jgi:acyl-CoA dehydrogenase
VDFAPTEAATDLAGLTRRILTDRLTQDRLTEVGASASRIDEALWQELRAAGVLSAALPEPAGGGFGLLEQCAVLIELGRAVAPVPYLDTITLFAAAIAAFGTDDQRKRWSDPAANGELIGTAALTEAGADDPATTAKRTADGWTVSGVRTAVPAGPAAGAILVPAATEDGPAVFLVEPADEGVRLESQDVVDLASAAVLELDEVRLPADRLLGEPAGAVLDWLVTRATVGRCALQLGVTERALEMTAEYARTRVQFDRPIGTFQAVGQRLADAYVDVEAIRLTLWQAAWRVSEDLPAAAEVATAKFWAADGGHRVAHTAVHVHGGMGIDIDYPLHRYFIAAKRNEFELGGATEQLRKLGAVLATEPA